MWEYIQNTKTRVVHSAGGCEDAREFGQGRGWRRLGSYLNLEIAAIESPGPGGEGTCHLRYLRGARAAMK